MASRSRPRSFLRALFPASARVLGLGLLMLCGARLSAEPRVWTSSDGKTVTAELISATDTTVTIKAEGGREFTLPHERLSAADREFVVAYLAAKKAEYDSIVWPPATAEDSVKATFLKRLHTIDPKRFHSTYAGKILLVQGQISDVKEDRMSSSQGVAIVLETDDRVPLEFKFSKAVYDKDLSILLGSRYSSYRGPYGEDEFRVRIAEKSLVVERRYVSGQDGYYNAAGNWRYRKMWSEWQAVARPLARGDLVKIRGEFVSVFNSVMSFKDAYLISPEITLDRSLLR